MSLILEALKKSEAQRRLGEAPNLGTPIAATRRRRRLLPWFVVAILIVGGGAWWLLQPHAVVLADKPLVAELAPSAVGARKAARMAQRANAAAGTPPPITAAQITTAPNKAATVAVTPPVAPPISVLPPPHAPPPGAQPVAPRPATDAAATAAVARAAQARASVETQKLSTATQTAAPASRNTPPRGAAATVSAPQIPVAPATPIAPPIAATPPRPEEPAVTTIDDLPASTRGALPNLPMSMLFYSADPSRRFILVDGERKKEGDVIGEVAVREIRASGAVLEFHGQRFLLPRPGS